MANNNEYSVLLGLQFDPNDKKKLDDEIKRIRESASGINSIRVGKIDGSLDKAIVSYTNKAGIATRETIKFNEEIKRTTVSTEKYGSAMMGVIKNTIQYATSIGLVYGALNQLSQGIEYISQLNKEMTNIQLLQTDGAKTDEQIASLALRYNSLAKELGATTLEVAKGSTEWLRQGKTIEQTQTLLRSSLMASKLGALESAQATEYLTAILNGFQMEASESIGVVDKLIK